MDIQKAKRINSNYFKTYSNGGYGRIPNAVGDDQVTTDQFVARRIQFPSTKVKEYYTDYKNSSFYQNNQNRALTTAQSIPALENPRRGERAFLRAFRPAPGSCAG